MPKSGKRSLKTVDATMKRDFRHEWGTLRGVIPQTTMDGFWLTDTEGNLLEVNETYCQMSRYSAQELLSMSICGLEAVEQQIDIRCHMEKIIAHGWDRFESQHRRKDGSLFDVEISMQYQPVDGGRMVAFLRDITERKRAEREFRARTDTLRIIFENAPYIMILVNEGGQVVDINRVGVQCAQRNKEALLGLPGGKVFGCVNAFNGLGCGNNTVCAVCPVRSNITRTFQNGEPVYESQGRLEIHRNGITISMEILVSTALAYTAGEKHVLVTIMDITERKRAEASLKAAHDNQRAIMASSPVGIVVFDEKACVVEANHASEQLFGKRVEEMRQQPCGEFIGCVNRHQDPRGCGHTLLCPACSILSSIRKVFDTGEGAHNVEIAIQLENTGRNKHRWLRFSVEPVLLHGQRHVIVAFQDISVERQAERRYQNLFQEMLDGFALHEIICDEEDRPVDYRFLSVNPAFERLTGLQPANLIGRTALEVLPNTQSLWIDRYGRVALSGEPAHFEDYSVEADRYFEVTAFSPAERQFACIFADVSERKRAEKALQESESLYVSLVENLPQNVFRKDLEGRFTFVNGLFCQRLERTAEEILGKTDYDFYPEELANQYRADDQWVIETGELFESEETYQAPGAPTLTVHIVKTPLRDAAGTVTGIQGLFWDITDRKQLEDQLRQAQKMEAIGTLAGGIAHDFNNILQSILVYAELSLDEIPRGSPLAANIEEILAGAKRARDLVARILTFSRQTEEPRKPLKLQPVIHEALNLLRGTLPTTIEISHEIDAACRPVFADATSIHQIIMNLCTNAYQAMKEAGGVLDVRLREIEVDDFMPGIRPDLPPGTYVRLSITDTGCGIDDAAISRIFDPYFTTKKVGEGSGLGLSVVHGIVKKLGGAIAVESCVGNGSKFEAFLPIYPVSQEEPQKTTQKTTGVLYGKERILMVDDEVSIAHSMSNALRKYGYQVEVCSNSLEARAMFRAKPKHYDVLVTDQTMPQITGMQLAGDLLSIRPDLPIILCTGYSDLVDELKAKANGIHEFLLKPFLPEVLAGAVRRVLDDQYKGAE